MSDSIPLRNSELALIGPIQLVGERVLLLDLVDAEAAGISGDARDLAQSTGGNHLAEWKRQSEEVLRRPGVSPRLVWVLPGEHQTLADLNQQRSDGRGVELRHSCNTIAPVMATLIGVNQLRLAGRLTQAANENRMGTSTNLNLEARHAACRARPRFVRVTRAHWSA